MARAGARTGQWMLDAHQHFWVYNAHEYGWMSEGMGHLRRDFLPVELEPLLCETGVRGTIAVQARRTLRETRWLLELCDRHPFIRGVVGWVDFQDGNLDRVLDDLADRPRLVGVRELIHDMPAWDYALSTEHLAGMKALRGRSLTYDLLLRPEHLGAATALADLFPQQRFVIDHIAKPRYGLDRPTLDARGAFGQATVVGDPAVWVRGIREIAERGNVYCKLSGLLTELDWRHWRVDQVTPYLDAVLEAFGPSRLMVGSDWPVCTCAADYPTTMRLLAEYTAMLSMDEQASVLAGTCTEFYGLDQASAPDR